MGDSGGSGGTRGGGGAGRTTIRGAQTRQTPRSERGPSGRAIRPGAGRRSSAAAARGGLTPGAPARGPGAGGAIRFG